ncbi:MAG: peptidoglycan DD-metalloendopeptidase family protein [Pararhodobacter sp.]
MLVSALALAGCNPTNMDWDLRSPQAFSTAEAARTASASRPQPDARGVISYPGYQVVIAQRGERVRDVASRLGISANELARHNAIDAEAVLQGGETLVLPSRVAEPGGAGSGISVTPLASATQPAAGVPAAGGEPIRHQVRRGETVFTIARLYNVGARTIADWNGLPADMAVREGQILIVPVPQSITEAAAGRPVETASLTPASSAPGQGSPTPVPPSASQPLPGTSPTPSSTAPSAPVADMAAQRTEGPRLAMPVEGRIIRAYARGRNDGIGIGAPAGAQVRAAAAGTVAAITRDTDQVPILVIRHDNNLLTVYANIDDIRVERGARVTRGQNIATVRRGDPSFLHFEVREGFDSVDPMPYLQ